MKKIRRCSNETIELPKFIRRIGLEDLYVKYKVKCEEQNKVALCRTQFKELAGKMTSGGQTTAISCVNYVDGNLVNDNCERLQKIVDAVFAKSSGEYKIFTENISHMKNFLKTQFDSHLQKNDGDAFHSLTHALCKPCRHDTTKCDHGAHSCSVCINSEEKFECSGCKFSFWLLAKLHDEVKNVPLRSSPSQVENDRNDSSEISDNLESQPRRESILVEDVTEEDEEDEEDESSNDSSTTPSSSPLVDADENDSVPDLPHLRLDDEDMRNEILEVIEDSSEKVYLYMKHRARVWCQREFYNELERELYAECLRTKKDGTKCIWVIDFKQKFEAMSARETQTEGFGK